MHLKGIDCSAYRNGLRRALLLLVLMPMVLFAGETKSLLIFHTNDLHAHVSPHRDKAGFARIAACVRMARKSRDDVLFLDAGDCIAGTPLSEKFKGVPIFEIMSTMGYDAAALGNHEFDFGWKNIAKLRKAADFPLLAANAFSPKGDLIADLPYKILKVNDVRIGLLGLITEQTPTMIIEKGNEGLMFSNAVETARDLVPSIAEKCDLVIAVTHMGIDDDRRLARQVKGIDLIIGGHSHTVLPRPERIGDTYILQTGEYGKNVGRLELTVDVGLDRIVSAEGGLIASSEMPAPDPKIAALVEKWESRIAKEYDVEIGKASVTWGKAQVKVLFEEVIKTETGADFGYYNPGGIRENLYKGVVLVRHIANIETFGNTISVARIRGKDILPQCRQQWEKRWGAISSDKIYSVAVPCYVGERTLSHFGPSIDVKDTGVLVRTAVVEYIKEKGVPSKPLRWE